MRALAGVVVAAGFALAGCAGGATPATTPAASGAASTAAVKVVASTNVWGDIAQQIGGDAVAVTSIIDDPTKDPHEYQANSRTQLALSEARVVIENGGGYDDFVPTMLSSAKNTDAAVLNAVEISGHQAQGGELNEHVWYDYASVRKVAEAIRDALTTAEPARADTFATNTRTFEQGLDKLDASVADLHGKYAGKGVLVTEPVPLYLTDAVGLVNRTPEEFTKAIEDGSDVPPAVLNETVALVTGHEVAVLAYNEQTSGPQTEKVLNAAQSANVPVLPVQETLPAGKDYFSWQTGIVNALGEALAK